MVLGNLSRSLSTAFNRLRNETIVNEEIIERTLSDICRALIEADVNIHLVKQLRENVRQNIISNQTAIGFNKRQLIKLSVRQELIRLLDPGVKKWEPVQKRTNIVMFVGLQGNGKTTTCTKYAYYYMKRGWKTALVCADTYRAGAFDQLQQNAFKARIPFFGNPMESDPLVVAKEGVDIFRKENYELIIVDTSGRHAQEQALFEEMLQLCNEIKPDNIIFVLNASIGQACELQAKAFKSTVDIGSVIITKMDSGAKGGGALSAVATTQSPIIYLGTGEHLVDFEVFEARSFVSKLLGDGDHVGLQKMIQEEVINPKSDTIERLKQGKFTLRDMYEQFQGVMKMGSIGHIMSMIPGVGTDLLSKNDERMSQIRLKKMMCIMDSMTDSELDHSDAVKLFAKQSNRYNRVARGAGVSVREVQDLLKQYSQISQVANVCSRPGFANNRGNSNTTVNELARRLDPRIINQVGGTAGLSAMLKQFQ